MSVDTFAIVIGVNNTPGGQPLTNAENDATELAAFLKGPNGPVGARHVVPLVGSGATCAALTHALRLAALLNPRVLFLTFSGHGSTDAMSLADAPFQYNRLAELTNAVPARQKTIVIDACHAGAAANHFVQLGGLPDQSWLEAFARSLPGTYLLLSSREDEASSDGSGSNGTFTEGLLLGLRTLPGDRHVGERVFISARAAFAFAWKHVVDHTGGVQTPIAFGPDPDFPFALGRQQPVRIRAVVPPPVAQSSSSGPSFGEVLFWGVLGGLAIGGIGSAIANRPRWDPVVGRKRGKDGRFRPS